MGRAKRADQFRHDEVGIAHCIQRCVRRAYLAGDDAVTGKSFEYRREWIRRRLELLAAVFGVDVLSYARTFQSFAFDFADPPGCRQTLVR